MPPEKQSVKESESLDDKDTGKNADRRQDRGEEREPENIRRENERKSKEIAELREELEAHKEQLAELKEAKEDRLEELQNKTKLTRTEKEEMAELEDQIIAISRDQRSKAWVELNRREAKGIARAERDSLDLEYAIELVEELAEKEDMSPDKFEKKIKPFLKQFQNERPTRKVKLAYKAFLKDREIEAKLAKLTERGEVQRENVDRSPRPEKKEAMKEAFEKGSFANLLRGLSEAQREIRKS